LSKKQRFVSDSMDWMVSAQGIYKSFGSFHVLKDLDLYVSKGSLVAIMGKSGSGKSTLLHILGTLDSPDQGQLQIGDRQPGLLNEDELAAFRNKQIGFVFQFHHLLPEFTLWENICIPGFIAGHSDAENHRKAKELIQYFGLESEAQKKPAQLSGGQQQRGAICRALFNEPAIVLADEPTGNLDEANAEEFHRMIRQLSKDFQQTFIIATHQADLADLCDQVYHLEQGRLRPHVSD
jgi:lipoprotein-releasing system ATP-binding protein